MLRRAWSVSFTVLCSSAYAQTLPAQPTDGSSTSADRLQAIGKSLRFTLAQIIVTGNTLVADADLQAVLAPLLGAEKTLDDLSVAKRTIMALYRDRGYELLSVDYNAPKSRGGVHQFDVREVKIGKVRVIGAEQISAENVRRQLPELREGSTPRMGQLARELFLFNDTPQRSATVTYLPAAQGVTDVEVKVAEKPQLHYEITLNNSGSASTGESRLGFVLHHDNLFDRSHQLTLGLTGSPEKPGRVRQISGSYRVPLPELGASVVLSASDSNSNSGLVANLFNVSGGGTTVAAHYQHSLARDAAAHHVLDVGFDIRRYRDTVDYFGVNIGTSVTTRPVSVAYNYVHSAPQDNLSARAIVQANVPGGSLNQDADYAASRVGASAKWQTLQLQGSWQHALASGWTVQMRYVAQRSSGPLIASEQFALGGQNAVRGFAEGEARGDHGSRANLEWTTPRFAGSHRAVAFADIGESKRLNPQAGELPSQTLGSYGLGWRGQFDGGLNIWADAAVVVRGTALHPKGSTRLHLSSVWFF